MRTRGDSDELRSVSQSLAGEDADPGQGLVWLCWICGAGFLAILVANAWVVDDAYITFRTVDNLLGGYGPTWNTAERVQAYSHPLWMLLLAAAAGLTGEFFFTSMLLSLILTLTATTVAASWLTGGFRISLWKIPLLLTALVASKAVIDFSSSGLEYPLAYLLCALYLTLALPTAVHTKGSQAAPSVVLIASLAFLTRPDSVVLYAPGVVNFLVARNIGEVARRVGRALLWSSAALIWMAFSLLYYGYPLPNTAYAKSLCTGFPTQWLFERGIGYLRNSLAWDTASHVMVVSACLFAWRSEWRGRVVVIGIIATYGLAVSGLAATTHMSGRHFAVPFFLAIVILVGAIPNQRWSVVAGSMLALYVAWSPVAAIKFGSAAYQPYPQDPSFIDTKFAAYSAHGALLSASWAHPLEDDPWFSYGLQLRFVARGRVHVAPEAIGFMGFAAGPQAFIVDRLGLSEPFLSRLPAEVPREGAGWKSGHFPRHIPEGYVESVQADENLVLNSLLRERYEVARSITRGRLLDPARLRSILEVNRGRFSGRLLNACLVPP